MAHVTIAKNKKENTTSCTVQSKLIYFNDYVRICAEACACCWDKPIPETYENKADYVGRRTKIGHTSILEHGNLIILTKITNMDIANRDDITQIFDAFSAARYLNVETESYDDAYYILTGGSLRGYEMLFTLCKNAADNIILRSIANILYENIDGRMFYCLTHTNEETGHEAVLDETKFINIEPDPVSRYFNPIQPTPYYESDNMKFISVDNIDQIKENILAETKESIFTYDQLARMTSLTILFKGMSRTATHQLVRHRNGITQESQRYVDYTEASFADPVSFKPDKYDPDTKYKFNFGGVDFEMTSKEIGENEIAVYGDLRDQGMVKEDARSFLPSNVKCNKIYMTFTYATFKKFLFLRCGKTTQAEIRSFADEASTASKEIMEKLKENVKTITVDEIISDKEVIMNKIIENEPELKEEN